MEGLFRNREVKDILIKTALVQLIFLIALSMYQFSALNRIKNGVAEAQAEIVGRLVINHPELEEEIVGSITKGASGEDIKRGTEVLSAYGYTNKMILGSEPVISKYIGGINLILFAIFSVHTLLLILLILKGYGSVFQKIRDITLSIQEILKGNYERHLSEGEEGDFSILGHHFNTMSRMIKQNLQLLNKERTFLKDILSDISHQLKTPMSSLIMLNDLMLEKRNMEEEKRLDFLNKTGVQLSRMNWLIKSLLKVARLEARAIVYKSEEIPLAEIVDRAIGPVRIAAGLKNIEIGVRDEKKASFRGDGEWTSEALLNIVKNCIEHTPEGGRIDIELDTTPISSTVKILDTGEGISREDLTHIFERFYKGSNSMKDDSIGIGLAMSKSIVEGQGGEIRVKSEKGKGTEFTVTFLRGVI